MAKTSSLLAKWGVDSYILPQGGGFAYFEKVGFCRFYQLSLTVF
jgi:hypothetical protein